ncbi:hypothetical protein AwWohl_02140 [Gammaproteobacteria bacterium]|nr:hypothetical protein AwWohl_02140 [Gammaproteobacteria bacterium]
MKNILIKNIAIITILTILSGCVVSPASNSGHFAMTPEQTAEVKRVSKETTATDRQDTYNDRKDAAEIRAWESKNSRPVTVKYVRPVYY